MIDKEIRCPVCAQADLSEKVSTVYLVGIGLKPHPDDSGQAGAALEFKLNHLPEAELRSLARQLKPPASTKRIPARPLHPDLVVLSFSLILPIFLLGVYSSQVKSLPPVLLFVLLAYSLYFWKRKLLIAKFNARLRDQREETQRVQYAIERWMKLYYCGRDKGLFLPGTDRLAPLDQLNLYLLDGYEPSG